jgi:dihydroorotate dehydrogenase
MYRLIRPLLFRLDAEQAHLHTLALVKRAGDFAPTNAMLRARYEIKDERLEVEAFGLKFKNPVGLAAGYDKDGTAVRGLSCLGFGHIEVGTLTPKPQKGNPLPRVHRVPQARALINSMGFPNGGVEALDVHRDGARVGINIGKGKDTPLAEAAAEYVALLRQVYAQADYVTLNVSSPNTLGLRRLQSRAFIEELLCAVALERNRLPTRKPVLVKIAPDLTEAEIDDVLAAVLRYGIDGIVATNTTVRRKDLPEAARGLKGGLSGAPLRVRSTEIIRYIVRQTHGKLPVVGVGGIASADDALEKLRAGAHLVQVFTGLVYQGPSLVRQIKARLLKELERERVPGTWAWEPTFSPSRSAVRSPFAE